MKDIDFLPQSYTNSRNLSRTWKRQYSFLAVLIAIVVSWFFVTGTNVRKASATTEEHYQDQYSQTNAQQEYAKLNAQLEKLNKQADLLHKVSSKICFSDVIAEVSFIAGDNIVLTTLDIDMEAFCDKQKSSSSIRVVSSGNNKKKVISEEPFRYKVTFHGLARDASDVAEFIRTLEMSDYFKQVVPGYSRNKTVSEHKLSEFELSCYIANYKKK